MLNSYAYITDTLWTINSTNYIKSDSGLVSFKGLKISSSTQSILIDGQLSDSPDDQLDILLKNFNLTSLKGIIPEDILTIEGTIDGIASITKQNNELLFTSDLNFDNFIINDNLIGKGNVASIWNTAQQSLKLDGKFYRDHIPSILFGGYYYPKKEGENLDLKLSLVNISLDAQVATTAIRTLPAISSGWWICARTREYPTITANTIITIPSFLLNTKTIEAIVATKSVWSDGKPLSGAWGIRG